MQIVHGRRTLACLLLASLWLGACAPSYRKDEVVQAIQQICQDEYHLDVTARLVGEPLAIQLNYDGILVASGNHVELAPTANEVLGNVIETVHRVLLSTDGNVHFYLVLASDPKVPGIAFTLVRYLDDVRRANANMLTPTEFYSRTIFDLHYVGSPTMSLDQLVPSGIQMEQFLSWQLAKRIQTRLSETLQKRGVPMDDAVRCAGEFQNGEFVFTLSLEPKADQQQIDPELLQQIFQDAAAVIAQVLSGYRFEKFDTIRLTHPPTGRSLLLPKTRLELLK